MKNLYLLSLLCVLWANSYGDQWVTKANFLGIGRELPASFAIGNKGYVGCGYNFGSGYLNDFWQYDPATNTWMQKASLPAAGRFATLGFSIGAKGYIGTGGVPYLSDFWEYDPVTNSWTQKANVGGGTHYAASGFSIGTKGYLGGGYSGQDFWQWDQGTDTWTQMTSFPGPSSVTAVGLSTNGKGYFITGGSNTTYEYDPVANTWTRKADYPGSPEDASGFAICGKLYVGTGESPLTDYWYMFDPVSNAWTQKTNVPGPNLDDGAAFAIGNVGYFGLGDDGTLLTTFYEYLPDSIDICGALPGANLAASDTVLCANDCITFTNLCSNSISYQWFFDGGMPSLSTDTSPQVCYFAAGSFNVKLIAANAFGSDSVTFVDYIDVQNSPASPYIIQNGTTLYFTTDRDYTSYQWYDSTKLIQGATDTFLIVSHGGNYNVVVSNKYGCQASVGINISLGLQNLLGSGEGDIKLYPNPVTDKFTVYGLGFMVERVNIYNALGQVLRESEIKNPKSEMEVDVSMLPSGIYFLQAIGEKEKWLGRFVKE